MLVRGESQIESSRIQKDGQLTHSGIGARSPNPSKCSRIRPLCYAVSYENSVLFLCGVQAAVFSPTAHRSALRSLTISLIQPVEVMALFRSETGVSRDRGE